MKEVQTDKDIFHGKATYRTVTAFGGSNTAGIVSRELF
jgi:hypothetical protein